MTNEPEIKAIVKEYSQWSVDDEGRLEHHEGELDTSEPEYYILLDENGNIIESDIDGREAALAALDNYKNNAGEYAN